MAATSIEWTDFTFNPWRGCSKCGPGCANCYAIENVSVRLHGVKWGTEEQGGTRVVAADATWKEPEKWNRRCEVQNFVQCDGCGYRSFLRDTQLESFCEKCGHPSGSAARPRVFCASLADVFEDWGGPMLDHEGKFLYQCEDCANIRHSEHHPELTIGHVCLRCLGHMAPLTMDDCSTRLFRLIDATPNLDWLLLTKRPENVRRMLVPHSLEKARRHISQNEGDGKRIRRRHNLWLGCSISTQPDADKNIPELLKCRDLAAKLFISAEPLVESVILHKYFAQCRCGRGHGFTACPNTGGVAQRCEESGCDQLKPLIDLVIGGGESGRRARWCNVRHIKSLASQCRDAGVAWFLKQLGSHVIDPDATMPCSFPERWCWPKGTRVDGQRILLNHPKGGDMAEWPESLRVRQFPKVEQESAK